MSELLAHATALAFDEADLYSCDAEAEELHHETYGDAIAEHVKDIDDLGMENPVTVYAWKRKVVTDGAASWLVDRVRDCIQEWAEDQELRGEDEIKLTPEIEAAIGALSDAVRTTIRPWCHDRVAKQEFSVAEARQITEAK